MKVRLFVFIFCLCAGIAQSYGKEHIQSGLHTGKHEIKLSLSDGIPLNMANFLGTGIGDAVTATERDNFELCGILGVGYRYSVSRLKIGGDIGFASMTSRIRSSFNDNSTRQNESNIHFLILPTGELTYLKRRKVTLYSSAALGAILTRTSYSTDHFFQDKFTENSFYSSDFYATFAFQINPIAIRVGNDRIGGFLEVGVGYKGFTTAGISILF